MRLIFLALLLCSCVVGPNFSSEPVNRKFYKIPLDTVYPRDLAPMMAPLGGLYLFKKFTVAVDQGTLGFSQSQLKLIQKACSYVNAALNEDVISYTSKQPDVALLPDEFVCCMGVTEVLYSSDKKTLSGTIAIKTVQDPDQFYATAVHELGHVLGLEHSTSTGSVMNEYAEEPPVSIFNEKEIQSLQYLRSFKNK